METQTRDCEKQAPQEHEGNDGAAQSAIAESADARAHITLARRNSKEFSDRKLAWQSITLRRLPLTREPNQAQGACQGSNPPYDLVLCSFLAAVRTI